MTEFNQNGVRYKAGPSPKYVFSVSCFLHCDDTSIPIHTVMATVKRRGQGYQATIYVKDVVPLEFNNGTFAMPTQLKPTKKKTFYHLNDAVCWIENHFGLRIPVSEKFPCT